MALADAVVGLLLAFVIIYVGAVILWSLNPLFAIFFVVVALVVAVRATAGKTDGL